VCQVLQTTRAYSSNSKRGREHADDKHTCGHLRGTAAQAAISWKSIMIKVVAKTSSSDELARIVAKPVFADVCDAVTDLMDVVESRRKERVTKILVHNVRAPECTSFQAPNLVNMGGKITHYARTEVHAPGVRNIVKRQANAFGVFMSIFTKAGNFHTSSTKTSTLFRGCSSRAAVQEAILHIFLQDSVHEVLVNNLVFSCRLGHPVSMHNDGIRLSLEALGAGDVQKCGTAEDNMFVHAFVLPALRPDWLRSLCMPEVPDMRVRININRTGVVNVFFGLSGGVSIDTALEEHLQPVCALLLEAMRSAV